MQPMVRIMGGCQPARTPMTDTCMATTTACCAPIAAAA